MDPAELIWILNETFVSELILNFDIILWSLLNLKFLEFDQFVNYIINKIITIKKIIIKKMHYNLVSYKHNS